MIYGYDTFEGMTEAGEFDIDLRNIKSQELLKTTKKINDEKNMSRFQHCGLIDYKSIAHLLNKHYLSTFVKISLRFDCTVSNGKVDL